MHQGYQPRLTIADKFHLFLGVILPAIAITIEASTHMCAEVFFDPIPTVWHLMLVLFVPLAQLHVWFTIRRGVPGRLMLAGFANAVAIGISIFYSIAYLPLAPAALLMTLIVVGLLPLSPFLSLIAALLMRQRLTQLAAVAPQRSFALRISGLLLALGLTAGVVGLIELPAVLTRYGIHLAASSAPQARTRGIRFLRNYSSKEQMLLSCYSPDGGTTNILGHLFSTEKPVGVDEARKIYYRVTGETFDMSAPPQRIAGRLISQETFDFENDQGGTRIGGKLRGLSLSTSKLSAKIDADGGVASLEWILAFRNDSELLREARAEIQLPPGGVVSQVALLKNDREHEAMFGSRLQAGQEYQVYQHSRNPVAVTTAGRDRILVQGFPVPAFGGEMKIRLGITVPLVLESRSHVRLLLPHFEGRNFRIPDSLTHSVWFDSMHSMATEYDGLYYGQMPDGRFILGGQLTDKQLSKPERSLLFYRIDSDTGTWSQNPFEAEGTIIKQWVEERAPIHLRRIVLVIDTSASMAGWAPEINAALGALPRDVDVQLVLADSEWLYQTSPKNVIGSGLNEISTQLTSASFTGGADNAPALSKAWNLAAEAPGNNAIVWIHSPQFINLESVERLRKRWESRPYGPLLYSVQTSKGSDEIVKTLDGINEVKSVVRMGTLRADLEQLFGQLSGRIKTFEFVRSVKKPQNPPAVTEGYKASDDLAKLWANDEIVRLLDARDEPLKNAATNLAVRYQLVTPVSTAAVMDMTGHYPNTETKPVNTKTVSRSEAEVETLFLAALLFVIAVIATKYRHAGGTVVTP
jgi:hypothetical protein